MRSIRTSPGQPANRRSGISTSIWSTAAASRCRASARRSSRTTPSWSAPLNAYWRKPNEALDRHAVPRFCSQRWVCAGQERREEGARTATFGRTEEAAGAHEGLQRQGRRQERRRAQEVHERLPQGRGRCRTHSGAESAARAHDGVQQAGDREEAEGRRAQDVHVELPQKLSAFAPFFSDNAPRSDNAITRGSRGAAPPPGGVDGSIVPYPRRCAQVRRRDGSAEGGQADARGGRLARREDHDAVDAADPLLRPVLPY